MFWCQREVGKNLNGHSVDELKSEKQFSHLESLVAVLGRGVHDEGVLDAGHDPQRDVGRAAVREGVPVRNVEPAGGRPLPHLESDHLLGVAFIWVGGTTGHFCQIVKCLNP